MLPEKTEAMKKMEKMLGIESDPEPKQTSKEVIRSDSHSEHISISQERFDRVDYYRNKGYSQEAIGHIEHLIDELVHVQMWVKDLKEENAELRNRIVCLRKEAEELDKIRACMCAH